MEEEHSSASEPSGAASTTRLIVPDTAATSSDYKTPMDAAPSVPVGSTIDRFRLLEQIGQGGMGQVFRAHDPQLGREVALKLVHDFGDPSVAARFRREGQAMARLSHPNVLPIYDIGTVAAVEGTWLPGHYIAMELVHGQTLRTWLQTPRPWTETLDALLKAGRGLEGAHAADIVHRDFKPSNVMVGNDGRVRVMDFGLASKATDPTNSSEHHETWSSPASSDTGQDSLSTPLTHTDVVLGTPAYMAPEQHGGSAVDHRCDQYGFCVTLWEAFYRARPFHGKTITELYLCKQEGPPPPPDVPGVPAWLAPILRRGLAVDPQARFESMTQLLERLEARRRRIRRRRLFGGLALAGVVGLGITTVQPSDDAPVCTGAQERLHGTWDPTVKQKVRAALLATGVRYAGDTWQRLEPMLDDYAARWADARTDACQSTRTSKSSSAPDPRVRCLDDHFRHLSALIKTLESADDDVVRQSVHAASTLPALGRCAEPSDQALEAVPEDPVLRRQVDELRDELARAQALQNAAKYDEAQAIAEATRTRAEALGFGPLLVETALRLGALEATTGDYEAAVELLTAAYFDAEREGQGQLKAEAAVYLTYIAGEVQTNYEEGLRWAKHGEAELQRNADPFLEADLLNTLGNMRYTQGRYDDSLKLHERALSIRRTELGPDHPSLAESFNNIGLVHAKLDHHEQALSYYHQSLELRERVLGPDHPRVANALNNIGFELRYQGRAQESLEYLRRAQVLYEKSLGPYHYDTANAHLNIGALFGDQDRNEEALIEYRKAVEIFEKALGPDHPRLANALNNLGTILNRMGKYEEAIAAYRRGQSIVEHALGPEHPDLINLLLNQGGSYVSREDYPQAIEAFERARSIAKKALGPQALKLANAIGELGDAYRLAGRPDDAIPLLVEALTIKERALGPDHHRLGSVLVSLGRTALDQEQFEHARAHFERAVSVFSQAGRPVHRGEVRFALAQVLVELGQDLPRAVELARMAREDYRSTEMSVDDELEQVEAWLRRHDAAD